MGFNIRFAVALCLMFLSACTKEATPAQNGAGDGALAGMAGAAAGTAGIGGASGAAGEAGTAGVAGSTAGTTGGAAGAPPVTGMAGTDAMPTAGTGGVGGVAGTDPTAGTGALPTAYDYENEMVSLSADLVIATGETLRVGPGTTFTATGAAVKIDVQGTLIVEGSTEAPAKFLGAGTPRSWHGIVIASGGYLELTNAEIGGATYGIHAMPGSDFDVDFADIGTSFKAAVIESDGTFNHTRFHASGNPAFSPVNEVSIDDVNGTLTILNASPTVSNSSFDGSNALVDMIRVGGDSAAVFDHIHVKEAHCGIHSNGGINNSPTITNSVFERLSYGMMIYATKPIIENSVFTMNGNDLGFCFGATADNAPVLTNNFYSSGAAIIDPSCFQIGAAEPAPAASANPDAGPVGL